MLRVDVVRIGLLCAASFICNFEDLYKKDNRYVADCQTCIADTDLIVTYECIIDNACKLRENGFRFWIEAKECDIDVMLTGSASTAVSIASDFINRFLSSRSTYKEVD